MKNESSFEKTTTNQVKQYKYINKIEEEKLIKEISPNESISDSKSSSNKSEYSEREIEEEEEENKSSRASEASKSTVESVNEIRSGSESRTSSSDSTSSKSQSNQSRSESSRSESSAHTSADDDNYESKEFIVEEKDKTKDSNNSSDELKSINKSKSTISNEEKNKLNKIEENLEKPIIKRKECKKKLTRKTRKVIYVDEIPKEYAKFLKPVEDKNEKLNELSFNSSKSPVKEFITKSSSPISSSPKPKYKIIPCECADCYWSKLIKDNSLQVFTI